MAWSAPPARTSISDTYPNPSNAVAKAGLAQQYDYVTSIAYGQCRLVKSGSNLVLQRFNGPYITINGTVCVIPSAGVSLAPTGLTPSTLYYIYAWMNGATMTLEASTTGHSTDSTTGMEIKTGDATRTLVGMAQPLTGPVWTDTASQRLVISWFNQRPLYMAAALGSSTASSSTGAYAILNNAIRLDFLSWNAVAQSRFQGRLVNNVVNAVSSTASFLDAANTESFSSTQAYVAGAVQPVACYQDILVSEGSHTFNVYAQQDVSSTATYTGGATAGLRCVHSAVIQG